MRQGPGLFDAQRHRFSGDGLGTNGSHPITVALHFSTFNRVKIFHSEHLSGYQAGYGDAKGSTIRCYELDAADSNVAYPLADSSWLEKQVFRVFYVLSICTRP